MNIARILAVSLFVACLGGCFGNDEVKLTCDEPQKYQSQVPGKTVKVPEGLDELDTLKEMPIPEAESEPRPPGSKCIETPPSILTPGE